MGIAVKLEGYFLDKVEELCLTCRFKGYAKSTLPLVRALNKRATFFMKQQRHGCQAYTVNNKATCIFRSLGLIMICSKIYKICMNVEMCEMCRPDTHALYTERLHSKVRRTSLEYDGEIVQFTISIGVALFDDPNKIHEMKKLIENADHALYNAKATGKNKTVVYKANKAD